jgi:GNAT superfamily N-acetyltransferase
MQLLEPKMKIHLQPYKSTDNEFFLKALSGLYSELGEEADSLNFLTAALIEEVFTNGNTAAYKVYCNDSAAGIITLTESQAVYAGGKYGTIDEMFILPEFRNKNIGSSVLKEIVAISKLKGWKRIDVTAPTEDKWVATIKFYERNGFRFTGPKLKRLVQ